MVIYWFTAKGMSISYYRFNLVIVYDMRKMINPLKKSHQSFIGKTIIPFIAHDQVVNYLYI